MPKGTCSVEGCGSPHRARGLCAFHYQRWFRAQPKPIGRVLIPAERRFWAKTDRSGECWLWTGAKNPAGYGSFSMNGTNDMAHRTSWTLTYGPIPEGMFVCHHCDNPPCVRPDHLFLGTALDNMLDKVAKGRAKGPTLKTHCKHGHEYTPENTYLWNGARQCRICMREYRRGARAKSNT